VDSTKTDLIRSIPLDLRRVWLLHHCGGKLPAQALDAVQRQPHFADFFRLDRAFALCQKLLSRLLTLFRKQSTEFKKAALRIPDQTHELVLQVDSFALRAISFNRAGRLCDDPLDFVGRQTGSRRDAHLLFAAGGLVGSRNRNDAVGVHFERNFDLRDAARGGRDANQLKLAQASIAFRDFAFTLQDVNFHR